MRYITFMYRDLEARILELNLRFFRARLLGLAIGCLFLMFIGLHKLHVATWQDLKLIN